jgi:hypothetical protein
MIVGTVERLTIDQPPARVLAALPRVVDGWGGTLTGAAEDARLEIPVLAGLRRGRVGGRLRVEAAAGGSVAVFTVESAVLRVNVAACAILLLSAAGAITSVAWPWFPRLLSAVPLGLVLAVGGWLLIASRLRSAGPEEFLLALRAASAGAEEESHTIDDAAGE